MTAEENKKLLKKYFEIFNTRDLAAIDRITNELFAPNWIGHSSDPHDREGRNQMIRKIFGDSPDFQLVIEDMIAENDRVVTRGRYLWTRVETKEPMTREFISIGRFAEGEIVELWMLNSAAVTVEAEKA